MFDGLNYITLYWLSGFGDPKYEIWEAKKATINRTPDSLSLSLYLAWPVEVADEGRVTIRQTDSGLVLQTDWFPDEDFDLKTFSAPDRQEIFLTGAFERENVFIHLHK
jgi:hypothetical protein